MFDNDTSAVKRGASIRNALQLVCLASTAALLWSTPSRASMPALVIPTTTLVSPASALVYYGSPSSPAAPSTRDPLVAELARNLKYNIDLIFAHVRDNVEYVPIFGVQEGARGVVLNGYGTDFDQAQFLVEALREADAKAATGYNPSYVMGQIQVSSADFASWTGVTDAAVATKLLANGGIPASVSGSGSSFTVTMEHVWVKATISGTTYVFDPSFKPHTAHAAMAWAASTGYSASALLSSGGGGTGSSISGFNISAFRSQLNSYRSSLESYITASAFAERTDSLIGYSAINPHPSTDNRRTSLPNTTSSDQAWAGQIPDIYRASFTVSMGSTTVGPIYADTAGDQALIFSYTYNASSNIFSLLSYYGSNAIAGSYLNDCDLYLASRSAANPAVVTISINHPYAAGSGTYGDRVLTKQLVNHQCSQGQFFITNDWGVTAAGAATRMALPAARFRADPANKSYTIVGPTLTNIASQYSSFLDVARRTTGAVYQIHDLIGLHTLDNVGLALSYSGTTTWDPSTLITTDFEGSVSEESLGGTTPGDVAAAFIAGLGLSIAEGAVPRQQTDAVYDLAGLSLLTQQDTRAAVPGTYSTYLATAASWGSVKGSLDATYGSDSSCVSTGANAKCALDGYNSEGYSLLVPQYGALREPPIMVTITGSSVTRTASLDEATSINTEVRRSAFLAWHPTSGSNPIPDKVALAIFDPRHNRVLKGGVGVPTDDAAGDIRKPEPPKSGDKDAVRAEVTIDGRAGTVRYAPSPDLTDGVGAFPLSLTLQRIYDETEGSNYGFGIGWKSNWHQAATFSNDGGAALGKSGAAAAASVIVTLQAVSDLVTTQDAQHLYAATQALAWLSDQTINNTVVIDKGLDGEETFYRQASGNWLAANGSGATLSQTSDVSTGIINRRLYSTMGLTFTDAQGTTRAYNYPFATGGSEDISSPSIASIDSSKSLLLQTWSFPNGVILTPFYFNTIAASDVTGLDHVNSNTGASITMSYYDYGFSRQAPYCPGPGQPVAYNNARPAVIKYQTSAGDTVQINMDAQQDTYVTGNPDQTPYCDMQGHLVPPTATKPLQSFAKSFVDQSGQMWSYAMTNANGLYGGYSTLYTITKPSGVVAVTLSYGQDSDINSLSDALGNAWNYYSSPSRSEAANPLQIAAAVSGTSSIYDRWGQVIQSTDALGAVTAFTYDDAGHQITKTLPEGEIQTTAYDVRGNPISLLRTPKPGSSSSPLTTLTTYVTGATTKTCSNLIVCNKTASETDASGNVTNYTWNTSTGGLTKILHPAVASPADGGTSVRPETDITFAGQTVGSATIQMPISRTDLISQSVSTTTTYEYDATNKLAPKSQIVDSASGGLNYRSCFKFDVAGNLVSSTLPNAGLTSCP